ncbi:MAG: hypothetical protein INQ03_06645 [Candidatus Heimdallarchaeota archaeon]|nr:hypothetical protein [Candidatus Heimdallarchaeota archaeon]
MKITIQTKEDNFMRMQIKEDPHTLFNLLRIVALEEDGVILAGYARDRTFEDSLMFQIRTEGDVKPETVLVDAARKVMDMADKFRTAFEASLYPED